MNQNRLFSACLLMLGLLLVVGCGPTERERAQLRYFPKAYQQEVSTSRFKLEPPDLITIRAPLAPEVNGIKQQISPTGTLNLDLLGYIYVAGLTPQELESLLTEKLRTYYKDVKVHVDVEYKSQLYYVFGEAFKPGPKPFTGRDTLVATLSEAQVLRTGWPERIYVVKPSTDPDKRHVTVVNMFEMTEKGDSTANVLLEQDDIVYIPLNPLAAVGVAIQNLLMPVSPVLQTVSGAAFASRI